MLVKGEIKMEQQNRWSWVMVPGNVWKELNESDFRRTGKFCVFDNTTKISYYLRRDKSSILSTHICIPEELCNQDFINWAVTTVYDFIQYMPRELITSDTIWNSLLACKGLADITKARVFCNVSMEQWCSAIEKYPDTFVEMPYRYKDYEVAKKYAGTPNASYNLIPMKHRTKEIFSIVFNSNDNEGKINLFGGKSCNNRVPNNSYDISFITQEMVEQLLEIDLNMIECVPAKFISVDNAKKAAIMNGKYLKYVPESQMTEGLIDEAFKSNQFEAIAYIPKKFQMVTKQKEIIDIRPFYIWRIPKDCLLDETIDYALEKDVSIFDSVNFPYEKKTFARCRFVVSKSGSKLVRVPKKHRTFELCLIAVTTTPSAIKYVPKEILTKKFYDEVISKGIVIPDKCMHYVKRCLAAHGEVVDLSVATQKTNRDISAQSWSKISICDIPGFFNNTTIREVLANLEIYTLGEFLMKSSEADFMSNFPIKENVIKDIDATIRLLRCKYFGENPNIDFDDNMSLEDIINKFGFSTRVRSCLGRMEFSSVDKKFFTTLASMSISDRVDYFKKQNNIGIKSVDEIVYRTQIVIDYYHGQKRDLGEDSREYTVEELYKRYSELKAYSEQLSLALEAMKQILNDNGINTDKIVIPKGKVLK